jgi:hypothetical protein
VARGELERLEQLSPAMASGGGERRALRLWGAEGENAGEWSGRGSNRRFEGELEAPRDELAGAWPPRGERGLSRSGDARGRARAGGREGGRAGQAEAAAWRGSARGAGPAFDSGPKTRRQPTKEKTSFSFYFLILFQDFQKAVALNQFLSKKMTFFGNGSKMKVA